MTVQVMDDVLRKRCSIYDSLCSMSWSVFSYVVCLHCLPKRAELSALQNSLTTEEARQQLAQLAEEVCGVGMGWGGRYVCMRV